MPSSKFDILLEKNLLQIKFRPTLKWFDNRIKAAKQIESDYKEWVVDKGGNVALFSPDSFQSFEVYTDNLTRLIEDELDTEKALDEYKKLTEICVNESGVEEIRRIGVRKTFVSKSEFSYEDLVRLLYQKYFKNIEYIESEKVKDLVYVVDYKIDEFIVHTQIGAVKKEESLKSFQSKFRPPHKIEEVKTDDNIFVDIDISIEEEIDKTKVNDILKVILTLLEETNKKLIKHISTA